MSTEEHVLFEVPAAFGDLSVTESSDGRRSLWFGRGRVCQGVVDLGRVDCSGMPYVAVALAGLTLPNALRDVLAVGLGAGVLPRFLHAYVSEATIDVVEIDPVVVDVAERFFEFERDDRLHVHVADGRQFIADSTRLHDAIVLDGYGLHEVPTHLSTREFLAAARAALRPGGVVVANVWGDSSCHFYECTLATYCDVFAQVYVLDVVTLANKIVLALPQPITLTREQLIARARAFSLARQLPLDLGDHVLGMHVVDEFALRGTVLRDHEV
jgi:spermidine synthase